ncbi:MAG: TonB family protein [Terracidiphilus sp.]
MEVLKLADYEKSETGIEVSSGAETKAGAVKHNGLIGLLTGALASGQAGTAGKSTGEKASDLHMTPEENGDQEASVPVTGHELDAFLGKAFKEEPIWASLWECIQDVFFPVKLPPLELTSKPIPVPDRMAVKANPWAIGISTTFNITILLLAIWLGIRVVNNIVNPTVQATNIDVGDYKMPKSDTLAGGGGGGGDRSIIEANKGKLPEKAKDTITPPQPQTIEKPKLPDPPTINVQKNIQLPDNMNMPMIGMKESANVTLASAGSGNGAGMGTGSGGGMGPGGGNGYGPGYGGNAGGGVYQVGGRISAPEVVHSVEAEFSDEARRAKYQGVCLISLIVDAQGNPQNIRVARALGMGLDEKAIEAIRQYKFRPAMKDGKTAVPVMITIEVDFRLY